jgi:SAM-dependent methyltransferase
VVTSDHRDIVAGGYDRIAARHLAWINEIRGDPRLRFLNDLMARLPARPAVLDLGCGAGVPCTALLAERGDVVGIDLSTAQLELARQNVPGARFIKADMATIELAPASFDAVTVFYSIVHVPAASTALCSGASPPGCALPVADSHQARSLTAARIPAKESTCGLERAGHVQIRKALVGKRPRTSAGNPASRCCRADRASRSPGPRQLSRLRPSR